jgi:hypothetical protein
MARKSTVPGPRSHRRPRGGSRRSVRKLPRKTDLSWIELLHRRWLGRDEAALAA